MLRIDINMLFEIINLLILFIAFKFVLFKPVQKIIAQRQEEALKSEPWIVIVIESSDAVAEISADKKIIGTIKGMLGKYRMMKVMLLMTNVENTAIPFGAPELMKIVKDNKRYLIFDDISNIKLCDLSVSITKKYAKPIDIYDAFYVNENELTKIKTVKLS